MLFNSWAMLVKTVVLGIACYIGVLVMLRCFGKRSLSKWNAFDWVVSVALGSTLANCILSKDVSLVQGLLAFYVLLGLQWLVTWLSMKYDRFAELVKSKPTLLVRDGKMQREAMDHERVTGAEVRAAVRQAGLSTVEEAAAVVLESDGTFSVVEELNGNGTSTLQDVRRVGQ